MESFHKKHGTGKMKVRGTDVYRAGKRIEFFLFLPLLPISLSVASRKWASSRSFLPTEETDRVIEKRERAPPIRRE